MPIQGARLWARLMELAEYGRAGETGVSRPALSAVEKEAFRVVRGWMEEAGMEAVIDDAGNLMGRLPGLRPGSIQSRSVQKGAPIVMMGSHLDTQPLGGRFDGAAGVIAAIEVVQSWREDGVSPAVPVEVAAFSDEESWRFGKGVFGSRALAGLLEKEELQRKDRDGVTREQALRAFGCIPERAFDLARSPGRIGAYLELHIEQGPVLERLGRPVGIVKGIAAPVWLSVRLEGEAGHAGSVPMRGRRDALAGAAEAVLALERIAGADPEAPTVATVGHIAVSPDSPNTIPGRVEFSVDLRDIDQTRRDLRERQWVESLQSLAQARRLRVEIDRSMAMEPRMCADWIKDILREESRALGLDSPELVSGPFHDASVMAGVCDMGMIFVRCHGGISHHPDEYATQDDLAQGAELLSRAALRAASRVAGG